nr:5-formyltetrahydrofolate cyclo-ligase, mitochondrial [Ipomoea batatas]
MSTAEESNPSSDAAAVIDAIFAQKKALRSKIRRDLKSMDPTQRSQEDEAIQNAVLKAPWFKDCKGLCAYICCSALREVDTSKILVQVLQTQSKDQKKLYVPRVEDKNRNMRMLNISSTEDLIANSMNILEPGLTDAEGNECEDASISIQLMYLGKHFMLCFNKLLFAVLLANEPVDLFLLPVALSYSVQIVDAIPVTPDDVLVDALITPSGVIPISQAAREICL